MVILLYTRRCVKIYKNLLFLLNKKPQMLIELTFAAIIITDVSIDCIFPHPDSAYKQHFDRQVKVASNPVDVHSYD